MSMIIKPAHQVSGTKTQYWLSAARRWRIYSPWFMLRIALLTKLDMYPVIIHLREVPATNECLIRGLFQKFWCTIRLNIREKLFKFRFAKVPFKRRSFAEIYSCKSIDCWFEEIDRCFSYFFHITAITATSAINRGFRWIRFCQGVGNRHTCRTWKLYSTIHLLL